MYAFGPSMPKTINSALATNVVMLYVQFKIIILITTVSQCSRYK